MRYDKYMHCNYQYYAQTVWKLIDIRYRHHFEEMKKLIVSLSSGMQKNKYLTCCLKPMYRRTFAKPSYILKLT